MHVASIGHSVTTHIVMLHIRMQANTVKENETCANSNLNKSDSPELICEYNGDFRQLHRTVHKRMNKVIILISPYFRPIRIPGDIFKPFRFYTAHVNLLLFRLQGTCLQQNQLLWRTQRQRKYVHDEIIVNENNNDYSNVTGTDS